jgi:hypothetical protein
MSSKFSCWALFLWITFLPEPFAEGISISGIGDGSVLTLSAGTAKTNLAITAQGAALSGTVVFELERQGMAFLAITSAAPYSLTLSNLIVGKYFMTASSGGRLSGDVSFDVAANSNRPSNDDWQRAQNITDVNITVAGWNVFATAEAGEPRHADMGIGKSVWWSWVAPTSAVFSATTKGSSFDTVLGVYVGTVLDQLEEIAANDDAGPYSFSQVTFTATAGMTYFFAVDGASANAFGDVKLRIVPAAPPTISFGGQTNWTASFVSSPVESVSVAVPAVFSDSATIAQVNYWLVGPSVNTAGISSSPYQLNFPSLPKGNYSLTLSAANAVDLITSTNIGFSVVSVAPELVLESFMNSPAQYQFGVLGLQGLNYDVEVSSNLFAWAQMARWTNFSGAEIVAGTNGLSNPKQFYRAISK